LIRSFLHAILNAIPSLIPEIFPGAWGDIKRSLSGTREDILTASEISHGFVRLMQYNGTFENHRFCFFIDGLDEYQGRIREDPRHLVEQLCRWTEGHQHSIKLCVSSREYNVFMNNLPSNQRLRLQQLTRKDMELYARDKLAHIPQDSGQDLPQTVTDKAEGIFLWMTLVIRRLREHFDDGAAFKDLIKDLDSIPQELDGLYTHIMQSLNPLLLEKAYQTFALVSTADKYELHLSLFAYCFLDRYLVDKSFAMAQNLKDLQAEETENSAHQNIVEFERKRLNGTCKGLVELVKNESAPRGSAPRLQDISDSSTSPPLHLERLAFTHRSVVEFLEQPKLKSAIDEQLKKFGPEETLSQLLLAEMRHRKNRWITYQDAFHCIHLPIRMRLDKGLDVAPYIYLETLTRLVKDRRVKEMAGPLMQASSWRGRDINISMNNPGGHHIGWDSESKSYTDLESPLYVSAYWGNYQYVQWKLQNDPAAEWTNRKLKLVYLCIQWGFTSRHHRGSIEQALHMVDALHQKGLPLNQPDTLYPFRFKTAESDSSEGLTLWQHLVLTIIQSYDFPTRSATPTPAYFAEKFLELGVETDLSISVNQVPKPSNEGEVEEKRIDLDNNREAPRQTPPSPPKAFTSSENLLESHLSEPKIPNSEQHPSDGPPQPSKPEPAEVLHATLLCGKEKRIVMLEYPHYSDTRKTHPMFVLSHRKGPASIRDIFEAWNPPNKARLLSLLQDKDSSAQFEDAHKEVDEESTSNDTQCRMTSSVESDVSKTSFVPSLRQTLNVLFSSSPVSTSPFLFICKYMYGKLPEDQSTNK
jgi:hypothetical protein